MTKQQLIDVLSPALIANGATTADAQSVLETYTVSQLEKLILKQTPAPTSEEIADAIRRVETILEANKKYELDFIDSEIKWGMQKAEMEREKRAVAEPAARKVFAIVAVQQGISSVEANFKLLFDADVLGSVVEATHAITSGTFELAPSTAEENKRYREYRADQHNQKLLSLSPTDLRNRVRIESEHKKSSETQEQAAEQLDREQQRDSARHFPILPADITAGKIKVGSSAEIRLWTRKFGIFQLNNRLRQGA